MALLFWLSAAFIIYTYVGYPILIRLRARKRHKVPLLTDVNSTLNRATDAWPEIAIIVPVHNEAHHIPAKIANLRQLDYPKHKLSLHFVSDGSEDGSNELIEAASDINLIAYSPRAGKPTALNTAVAKQTAPIIVFTDARQIVAPDAVKKIVNRLQQPGIGAVSGELCFTAPGDVTAQNVGLYWRYEKAIRTWESMVHSVAGVTGALHTIRRADYVPLYEDALLDDFEIPIQVLRHDKRIVLEPGAQVFDQAQSDAASEKTRKIRTLTGNFQSFAHNPWLFSRANPIVWQFLSHKVCRLLVPYAMALALITNLFLLSGIYRITLLCQLGFYGLGLAAMRFDKISALKIPNLAAVFLKLNWAAVLGLYHYRKKSMSVRWEKTS